MLETRAGVIIGSVPIGKVLGGYSRATILRWHSDRLLEPFVFKGPHRNSELRLNREDVGALKRKLRSLGVDVEEADQ